MVHPAIVYSGDKKGISAITNLTQHIIKKKMGSMKNFVCVEVCSLILNFLSKQSYLGHEFETHTTGEEKYP